MFHADIAPSSNQSINQSINQSAIQLIRQPASQPTNQPINQFISSLVDDDGDILAVSSAKQQGATEDEKLLYLRPFSSPTVLPFYRYKYAKIVPGVFSRKRE